MTSRIINDSMLNLLKYIEPNTIDSIVTDPPYELGFMGKSWDASGIAFQPDTWRKCFETLKPGGYLLAFGGSRTFHRIACAIEDAGFGIRDTIMWLYGSGFPKSLDVSKAIDKSMGAEREVIGKKQTGCFNSEEKYRYTIGSNESLEVDITAPSTDLAKQWQGWGTALKPAFEPIIVARKPMQTSVAENVMKYGVGGINIDECRVETTDDLNGGEFRGTDNKSKDDSSNFFIPNSKKGEYVPPIGRFPANVIHDGSEETTENMLEASRYFYSAKTSKKDRDAGLKGFENHTDKAKGNGLDRICEFCGVSQLTPEKCHCEVKSWITKPRKNTHPTVKPCELMQYLVRLVSPKGATILDPFMGSGSTGKAVMFENRERNANYKFIGIDLEKEYCDIAEARIDYALNKYEYDLEEEIEQQTANGQMSLFDTVNLKQEAQRERSNHENL